MGTERLVDELVPALAAPVLVDEGESLPGVGRGIDAMLVSHQVFLYGRLPRGEDLRHIYNGAFNVIRTRLSRSSKGIYGYLWAAQSDIWLIGENKASNASQFQPTALVSLLQGKGHQCRVHIHNYKDSEVSRPSVHN